MGPLNLIEQPMRRYITSSEATTEDSPQRFLQQFSKSVVGKATSPSSSRVPLGPISSAIFGNNATARGAHEITDIKEDALPEDVQNLQDDIRDLRILRDTMYKPGIDGGTGKPAGSFIGISPIKPPPRGLDTMNKSQEKPVQETVVRIQNGKLNTQVVYAATSSGPGFHHHQQQQQQQQHSVIANRTPASNSQTSLSATPGSMVYTEDLRPSLYRAVNNKESNDQQPEVIDLDKQRPPPRNSSNVSNVLNSKDNSKKPAGGGLKWISLNDENSSSCSQAAITTNTLNQLDQQQHQMQQHQMQQHQRQQQQQQQQQQQLQANISNPTYGSLSSANISQQQQTQNTNHPVYIRGGIQATMNTIQDYKQQQQRQVNTTGQVINTSSNRQSQSLSHSVPKTTPSSSVIPVPLASRFNQTPHKKSLLDGKFVT